MIQDECDKYMSGQSLVDVLEGSTIVTTAGKLECKLIIHAVGPTWNGGNNYEIESLSEAIINSLRIAEKRNCTSIAFPAISTGNNTILHSFFLKLLLLSSIIGFLSVFSKGDSTWLTISAKEFILQLEYIFTRK